MTIGYLGDTGIGVWPFDNIMSDAVAKAAVKAKPGTRPVVTPGNANNPQDALLIYTYAQANKVHDALLRAGLSEPAASYGTFASYHETRAYSNAGAKQYTNYSGIKFANQNGATKGPNGYAVFRTIDDWAKAYAHELTKGKNPAGATSLEDFAARLKANGYYEDSLANYTMGLKRARLVLKILPAADGGVTKYRASDEDRASGGDLTDPAKPVSEITEWWGRVPWYGKVGIGTAAGLIILAAVKN